MSILSFQNFLKKGKPKASDYVRYLHLLLDAIGIHASGGDDDVNFFRFEIASAAKGLTEQTGSEAILVLLGTVVQLLGEQNRRANSFMKAHAAEMQAMLGMMSSTIAFLAASSDMSVNQLRAIERHVENASNIDDIRLSRLKLSDCLTVVRNESIRLRDESKKQIQVLQASIEVSAGKMRVFSGAVDPATGLSSRRDAEKTIATSLLGGVDIRVALFLVDGLVSINTRFGRKTGDEILLMVAQHLAQGLPKNSQPFRWSGPAFIAVIAMAESSPLTERHIQQLASTRLEKTIEAVNRTILLPISCSVVIEKIAAGQQPENVFRSLDKFVATRTGEAYGPSNQK